MTWWRKLLEWDNKGLLADRIVGDLAITKRGYVLDRRIFKVYLIVFFLSLSYVMYVSSADFREIHVHCPENGPSCANPCYGLEGVCSPYNEIEQLYPGQSFGNAPDPLFFSQLYGLLWITIGGLLVAFGVNHLCHNRGRPLSYLLPEAEE